MRRVCGLALGLGDGTNKKTIDLVPICVLNAAAFFFCLFNLILLFRCVLLVDLCARARAGVERWVCRLEVRTAHFRCGWGVARQLAEFPHHYTHTLGSISTAIYWFVVQRRGEIKYRRRASLCLISARNNRSSNNNTVIMLVMQTLQTQLPFSRLRRIFFNCFRVLFFSSPNLLLRELLVAIRFQLELICTDVHKFIEILPISEYEPNRWHFYFVRFYHKLREGTRYLVGKRLKSSTHRLSDLAGNGRPHERN